MTLCLAWKNNNQIHFASDSRISFRNSQYIDIAIKIFSIPVKIFSAIDAQSHQETLDYDHSIGMCFAGSSTNAYLVKESIYEVLQHLQYTPHTGISMNGIADVVSKFYEHTTRKICNQIAAQGIATFFLGGFCPATAKIKVYKFDIDCSASPIRARYEEVLTQDGIEFLGNGRTRAKEIRDQTPDMSEFRLLKQVINDPGVPSVGGNIQYGTFKANNFLVYGVQDYEIEPNNQVRIMFNLRGTEIYQEQFKTDFHISYPIIMPFERDIEDAIKRRD